MEKKVTVKAEETQVAKLTSTATKIKITNDDEMVAAGEFLKNAKDTLKGITARKEEITKPINESLKSIRAMFKPLEEQCEEAISSIGGVMLTYQKAQDDKRRKIEDEEAARIEQSRKDLDAGKITEREVEKIEAKSEKRLEKAPEVVTKSSSFHTRTVKKLSIIDIAKIPREFLKVDEVLLKAALTEGRRVPGAELVESKIII